MLDKPIKELNRCYKSPRLIATNSPNSCTAIVRKKMTLDRSCIMATLCTWKSSIELCEEIRYEPVQKRGEKTLRQTDGIFKIIMKPASGKIFDREVRRENKHPLA